MLGRFLTKAGYEVITASNGERAIEIAKKQNPASILLDINMPVMGGIEACKTVKADEKTCSIPVIMVTAYPEQKIEALQAGADDFVDKPYDLVEVSVRVKCALRIRHLTDELSRVVAYMRELEKNLPKR